jgi:16S rRNA (cytidine1402-2'-O)-methyltransferase
MVFYESVHRIKDSLADMADVFGADRPAFIGRELTKLHEQCVQAPLGELVDQLGDARINSKGEFVIIVGGLGDRPPSSVEVDSLLAELVDVMPARQAAAIAARVTGTKPNELYKRILELTEKR